jgi:hypothetical protein
VRWPHSLVTDRIPSTGSSSETTHSVPWNRAWKFWSFASPAIRVIATIAAASSSMISSSQKPARVSAILRSSTRVSRGRPARGRVSA